MNSNPPIPTKLKEYFIVEEQHDDFAVKGKLKCSCGSEIFKILYFGKKGGLLSPTINKKKTENGKRIAIDADCIECHKKISIYDSFADGLRNCHGEQMFFPINYTEFICEKCCGKNMNIEIAYNSLGEKELISKKCNNWQDCFSMIMISTKCNLCAKKYNGFIEQ